MNEDSILKFHAEFAEFLAKKITEFLEKRDEEKKESGCTVYELWHYFGDSDVPDQPICMSFSLDAIKKVREDMERLTRLRYKIRVREL